MNSNLTTWFLCVCVCVRVCVNEWVLCIFIQFECVFVCVFVSVCLSATPISIKLCATMDDKKGKNNNKTNKTILSLLQLTNDLCSIKRGFFFLCPFSSPINLLRYWKNYDDDSSCDDFNFFSFFFLLCAFILYFRFKFCHFGLAIVFTFSNSIALHSFIHHRCYTSSLSNKEHYKIQPFLLCVLCSAQRELCFMSEASEYHTYIVGWAFFFSLNYPNQSKDTG